MPLNIQSSENDLTKLNFKSLYSELVKLKCTTSKAVQDFSNKYEITNDSWKKNYKLPYELKLNNRLKEFQYRITHGYLTTNLLLYRMKILNSPRCNFCNLYNQSLEHMFFQCLPIRNI